MMCAMTISCVTYSIKLIIRYVVGIILYFRIVRHENSDQKRKIYCRIIIVIY